METFSALLAICAGNSPATGHTKCQWRGALVFTLICARINGWVNNREAGDSRRHRAHYDVNVMNHLWNESQCNINSCVWGSWLLSTPPRHQDCKCMTMLIEYIGIIWIRISMLFQYSLSSMPVKLQPAPIICSCLSNVSEIWMKIQNVFAIQCI